MPACSEGQACVLMEGQRFRHCWGPRWRADGVGRGGTMAGDGLGADGRGDLVRPEAAEH